MTTTLTAILMLAQGEAWERIKGLFEVPEQFRAADHGLPSVLKGAKTPEEWALRRAELLKAWHEVLGPWPALIEKPFAQEQWKDTVEGFTRRYLEMEVAPGRKAKAYYLTPPGKGPFPAVLDVFYYPEDGAGVREDRRNQNDFGYQLVKRGFAALCVGMNPTAPREAADLYYPSWDAAQVQPLSYLAYVSANLHTWLAQRPEVDGKRIGVVGHSYGGKWALFAGAFWDKFAAVCVSDPGIVFDELRGNVNYWEPWYLGYAPGRTFRPRGLLTAEHGRAGAYKVLRERGMDLHEVHALICPRPFFVSGGSEDPPSRWGALNHSVAVNRVLGVQGRVGMSNRPEHRISPEASGRIADFFVHFLGSGVR
jgi:dienelactone hydrolase